MMKLDIGCGTTTRNNKIIGKTWPFEPKIRGEDVIYGDINPPEIKIPNFIRMSIYYLPFKSNALEHIVASHLFEHLLKPREAATECWRVLEPHGRLTVIVPTVRHPKFFVGSELNLHVNQFNRRLLIKLFKPFFRRVKVLGCNWDLRLHYPPFDGRGLLWRYLRACLRKAIGRLRMPTCIAYELTTICHGKLI